jgi:hypothetical protein
VPRAARIGVLANVSDPKAPPQLQELEAAGRELGVTVVVADAPTPDDVDGAFRTLADHRIDVMVALQTSMLLSERQRIASLAATTRLPAVQGYREHVDVQRSVAQDEWCRPVHSPATIPAGRRSDRHSKPAGCASISATAPICAK